MLGDRRRATSRSPRWTGRSRQATIRFHRIHPADEGAAVADHTYVVNEVVGTSPESVNKAIDNGIQRASRTLRNLDWFELVSVRGSIADGQVSHYQVTMKVGFRLEETD
jgi:dodecin